MTRKEFLELAAAGIVVPLTGVLSGCSAAAVALRASVSENLVRIPVSELPDLNQPNAYAKVYVDAYANPFILFSQHNGEIWAVLSTCSHSGCEVKKTRSRFECPCHGSEYDLYGNVLRGPAPEPLDAYKVNKYDHYLEFILEGT